MGSSPSAPYPPRHPVPAGKTRLCVAGFKISPFTGHSRATAAAIAAAFPEKYETWFFFDTTIFSSGEYYAFLKHTFDDVPFPPHLKGHCTSPFVWLENGNTEVTPIGSDSQFSEWVQTQPELMAVDAIKQQASTGGLSGPFFHNGADAPQSTANMVPTPAALDAKTTTSN